MQSLDVLRFGFAKQVQVDEKLTTLVTKLKWFLLAGAILQQFYKLHV